MASPGASAPEPTIPEPSGLVEAGVTTSEWALVVRYLGQLAVVGSVALIARAGWHVDGTTLSILVSLELTGAAAVFGYAISRGLRKAGTPG